MTLMIFFAKVHRNEHRGIGVTAMHKNLHFRVEDFAQTFGNLEAREIARPPGLLHHLEDQVGEVFSPCTGQLLPTASQLELRSKDMQRLRGRSGAKLPNRRLPVRTSGEKSLS